MRKLAFGGILLGVWAFFLVFVVVPGEAQDTIKIGFFAPITGPAAADGASAKNAVELGLKEVNDAGGVRGRK